MKTDSPIQNSNRVSGCVERLVRGLLGWTKANIRSLKSLAYVFRYATPAMDSIRQHMKPSSPRLLLGEKKWYALRKWEMPRLDVSIMDGMGEHYGYPRHRACLILWWNRRGYAWGVEYSANSAVRSAQQPQSSENPTNSGKCEQPDRRSLKNESIPKR